MPQRSFDGSQDHVEAQVNQVNSSQRDDDISSQYHASIQHVVENIKQRHLVAWIVTGENHGIGRRAHLATTLSSGLETNE